MPWCRYTVVLQCAYFSSINTCAVCCPHRLKSVPIHRHFFPIWLSTLPQFVQLSINTSSVCCPHRLKRVPTFIAGADTRWSHLFRRWCRHSMLPIISSVLSTLALPPSL